MANGTSREDQTMTASSFDPIDTYVQLEDGPAAVLLEVGDELVYLISGAIDRVLFEDTGERVVGLRGRGACLVPRGVWHTARVHEPSEALHITRGAGILHEQL